MSTEAVEGRSREKTMKRLLLGILVLAGVMSLAGC